MRGRGGSWVPNDIMRTASRPLLANASDQFRFVPISNWNGTINFTVAAFQAVRADDDGLGLSLPYLPRSVLKALDKVC